jgi:hypothetical protein
MDSFSDWVFVVCGFSDVPFVSNSLSAHSFASSFLLSLDSIIPFPSSASEKSGLSRSACSKETSAFW